MNNALYYVQYMVITKMLGNYKRAAVLGLWETLSKNVHKELMVDQGCKTLWGLGVEIDYCKLYSSMVEIYNYMVVRRYGFNVQAERTISCKWAQRTSEILFYHKNIKSISLSYSLTLSHPEALLWWVKSSGVRQSKIIKCCFWPL